MASLDKYYYLLRSIKMYFLKLSRLLKMNNLKAPHPSRSGKAEAGDPSSLSTSIIHNLDCLTIHLTK